jgi:hypothetical protein
MSDELLTIPFADVEGSTALHATRGNALPHLAVGAAILAWSQLSSVGGTRMGDSECPVPSASRRPA